jgi:Tol biopolymer transport system component
MPPASGDRLGPYQIVAQIGEGGMGRVYRATDTRLKRDVAIKVLPDDVAADADRLARFQREAEVLAALNHPHIAAIHGLEDAGGSKALVMELVEGDTLADVIARGPSPAADALLIARQIAEALDAAHERGIIHRDLKPANIKVRADGVVKVLDFGLAKTFERHGFASSVTLAPTISVATATLEGTIVGTPAYMSPEQARGRPVDRRTDVWAFGAILFEMLTGTKAFPGEDISQVMARVIEREPDWSLLPPGTPARVSRAIAVCLRKDPRERIGDLTAVCLVLDGAFETAAAAAATASSVRRPAWRQLVPVAIGALLVGAVAGGLAWNASRNDAAPRVERFVITTPANRGLLPGVVSVGTIAVSPDGSLIAYGTASGTGQTTLEIYVRSLGSVEATLLRGTENGGTSPFFSPDGQFIGFVNVNDNTLRRVPVAGGAVQTLARFDSTPIGMEWTPDGFILFSLFGPRGSPLMRIPATGGEATPLTVVDTAAGDRVHLQPDVLPGGDAALFTIASNDLARLAVVSLATGTITDLKIPGIDPSYSPTGHIIYGTAEGTLEAIPFDADRLAVTGAPVQVLENVVTRPDVAQFALAGDGSLVYVAGSGAALQWTLTWVDRNGDKQPLGVPPRIYATPRLSPDGTRAAMVIAGDIWVTELARPGTLRRVTTDPARERFPLWTPDSQRLIFESNKGGTLSLVSKAADGRGEETRILSASPEMVSNIFSPEAWLTGGRELLFIYRRTAGNDFDIGRVAVDGTGTWQPVLNTDASESGIAMSPDGRRIAYEANDTGQTEIYVEDFPSLGNRQIVSTGGGMNPLWSRDGRELYYRRTIEGGGGIMVSPIQTVPVFSPGTGRQLFTGAFYQVNGGARQWDVAGDGRFLMQESVDQVPAQLMLVRNWTEELRRLAPAR